MLKNHLKIAWRNLLQYKLYTTLNVLGLSLGFAGFVLAYLYINRETSYDKWNPNYENIYLVGLSYQGSFTDLTPPALSKALEAQVPEIELAGRISYFPYEFPFLYEGREAMVKDWKGADRSIAQMFDIEAHGFSVGNRQDPETNLISPSIAQTLFSNKTDTVFEPRLIGVNNEQTGLSYNIHGVTKEHGLSNLAYDAIFFRTDLAKDQEKGNPLPFQTFIQVKPGTDIALLNQKINDIYKRDISQEHHTITSAFAKGKTYLDPLKNLHLRPKYGSNVGYITIWALGILSGTILLLGGINFANLMIAQANKRAKEIGIKKMFGVTRVQMLFQFLFEVVLQCLLAAVISWVLVILCMNSLQKWLAYDLSDFAFDSQIVWQLLLAALLTALVSGLYPAIILSGYHPASVLKGNFQTSHRTIWFRHALLTFQFVIAIVFITGMLFFNRQLDYMRQGDKGFDPAQVVLIKNMAIISNPADFRSFRDRMKSFPGIEYATVATSTPGGNGPAEKEFQYLYEVRKVNHIGVDFDYFETLGMNVLVGRSFTEEFAADTMNGAVINEAAAKEFGIANPIGKTIRGCETDFHIIGVVKDSKMQGFEEMVRPTVYSVNNPCGKFKTEIMIKMKADMTSQTLTALEKEWKTINKLDGEHFRYEFVDQKYAALYAQQEQLESAFNGFTILSVVIAVMGLFSMSAYSISIRQKEMSTRKVLGASVGQLFVQLNKPFFCIFLLSNLIALPLAYLLVNYWLANFAYHIEMQWWVFLLAGLIALIIALFTVTFQSIRMAQNNPVESLRDE